MLTRLTVNVYAWIIEIYLWFALLVAGVLGYYYTVPALDAAGAIVEHEVVWKISGALFFAVTTFLMLAVLVGPFLMLVDIRKSVRALEKKSSGSDNDSDSPGIIVSPDVSVSGSSSRSGGRSRNRGVPAEPKEPYL
jgi:hypothetical protein